MTDNFVQQVSPVIGELGFRYYFAAETAARAGELGLDPFSFYFLGRGGVLGDAEASVVSSAFGYFNPAVVAMMWESGRSKVAPREAGREHLACCAAFGRKHLSDLDGIDDLGAALSKVNDAASRSLAGLALYAGMVAEPVPDDAPARAMHLLALLREHRGGVHLAAVVAAGVDPAVAHFARRPGMWETFGWDAAQVPTVTDQDRRRLTDVDATTDQLVAPVYAVLDAGEQQLVVDVLAAASAAVGDDGTLPG